MLLLHDVLDTPYYSPHLASMSKIVILDNGHGGMIGGQYQTAGKRSPDWEQGILYEGAFNRWIVALVMQNLDRDQTPYYHISPELHDISLGTRVKRANELYIKNKNVYTLSIHANAGGGHGVEGFTSKGDTPSDPIAEEFLKDLETSLDARMRFDYFDGDRDKEKDYYILRKTKGPALLLEMGFMDHKKDYKLLWSREYQVKLAKIISDTITRLYRS